MTILSAAVLLGILIFVHEFGHFLFAKLSGVKVLKFSLGFGPKIVGRTVGETEYRISALPLGGYVKMLGEEPGEELPESERDRAYNFQPVVKRVGIVASGPIFNLLFAAVLFSGIFMAGVPVPYPDIGRVEADSPAGRAGLRMGDRVLEIDGRPVKGWDDIASVMDGQKRSLIRMKVLRDGKVLDFSVAAERKMEKNIFGEEKEQWIIGISPLLYPVIGEVIGGTPADKAGLKEGDRVLSVDGAELQTWEDMTDIIRRSPEKPLDFTVRRGDRTVDLTVTPEKRSFTSVSGEEQKIGLIGVKAKGNDFVRRYSPFRALSLGVKRTWDVSVLTLVSLEKLVERVIPAKTIGGPIMIFQMAGREAEAGAMSFFTFMAVISINLGVLNLLPIPILDGGHVLFLGIEAVRGRPLSERAIMLAQRIGLTFLLGLMAFAFYNDIVRLITGAML